MPIKFQKKVFINAMQKKKTRNFERTQLNLSRLFVLQIEKNRSIRYSLILFLFSAPKSSVKFRFIKYL